MCVCVSPQTGVSTIPIPKTEIRGTLLAVRQNLNPQSSQTKCTSIPQPESFREVVDLLLPSPLEGLVPQAPELAQSRNAADEVQIEISIMDGPTYPWSLSQMIFSSRLSLTLVQYFSCPDLSHTILSQSNLYISRFNFCHCMDSHTHTHTQHTSLS